MSTILITGANRGIGLALTQTYLKTRHTVIAVCRTASSELLSSGAQVIEHIDVTDSSSIQSFVKKLDGTKIDILINNAGAWCDNSLENMNFDGMIQNFEINAVGTLRVVNALLPHFNNDAKIAIITSKMGSISDNQGGGRYGYRMSKAALNAAGKSLAIDLKPQGISVALIHPGWVQTDMGGPNALITAEQSAKEISKTINNLSLENTGSFLNYDGQTISW